MLKVQALNRHTDIFIESGNYKSGNHVQSLVIIDSTLPLTKFKHRDIQQYSYSDTELNYFKNLFSLIYTVGLYINEGKHRVMVLHIENLTKLLYLLPQTVFYSLFYFNF